jgi:hypothetical protein
LLKDDGGGNHVISTFDDGAPAWATPRRQKIPLDHLYSSMLIRGIVKNQNPKRVCGRPVIIKNRANGQPVSFQCRSALLVSPAIGWRIAATTGPAASLSDQRPPALNVAGYLIYEQGPIDFVGTGPPPNLRAPGGDALQVSKLAGRCPGGKRNETLPEPQLAKAFCGSRATLLAILASAISLRIDEFFRLPIK